MSVRLLTIKNNNHTDLRTFYTQLSDKGCQYIDEDYKNKTLS